MEKENNHSKRFKFGKYSGKLISDITILDPSYIKWVLGKELIKLPSNLKV
jgi:hypothetical protein